MHFILIFVSRFLFFFRQTTFLLLPRALIVLIAFFSKEGIWSLFLPKNEAEEALFFSSIGELLPGNGHESLRGIAFPFSSLGIG